MPTQNPQIAPTPLLVCYLARIQRFFEAVINYTQNGDKDGILLGGWLANALHHVPGLLWNVTSNSRSGPEGMEAWMQEFPETLRHMSAPERLINDSRRILSAEHSAQTLNLRDDLADVDTAPLSRMRMHSNKMYWACIYMRTMRGYGGQPSYSWERLEQTWAERTEDREEAEAHVAFNYATALALLPLPQALVGWRRFDEQAFYGNVLEAAKHLPSVHYAEWIACFAAEEINL